MNRQKVRFFKILSLSTFLVFINLNVNAQFLSELRESNGLRRIEDTSSVAIVHQTIEIFPLAFVGSSIMASYERLISQKVSFKLNGAFGVAEKTSYYNLSQFQSLYIEPQIRFYANGDLSTLNGAYLGIFAYYKNLQGDYYKPGMRPSPKQIINAKATAVGMIVGNKFIIGKHYVVDVYCGSGIQSVTGNMISNVGSSNVFDAYKNRIIFQPGLSIGYGF